MQAGATVPALAAVCASMADLQKQGEALQGEALAGDHRAADPLGAVLELGQHDRHIVSSGQRNHHHPVSLLWGCTACTRTHTFLILANEPEG